MRTFKLSDFKRGWIIGLFDPALYNFNYELGFKYYTKGDYEKSHKHSLSREVTIILFGNVEMNGKQYSEGDILI